MSTAGDELERIAKSSPAWIKLFGDAIYNNQPQADLLRAAYNEAFEAGRRSLIGEGECEWCHQPEAPETLLCVEVDHPQLGGHRIASLCEACIATWDSTDDEWRKS
jgi:hypothetical protein